MSLTVRIEKNALPALGTKLREKLSLMVRTAAANIEANAKTIVPIDTGALKASIQAKAVNQLTSDVEVGQSYGIHVEFGTSRMGARPYLTPSVDKEREPFLRAAGKAVEDAAREASGGE